MVRSVVNSFLYSFWSFNIIGMVFRPWATKIFSINLNDFSFRMSLLDFLEYMIEMIMEFFNCISGIIESLIEVISRIFTGYRNLFGEKIGSSSIFSDFILTRVMNGEVGSMYFLRGNPEDIRLVKVLRFDFIDELISGWELNGRILFECEFDFDLLVLHLLKFVNKVNSFIWIQHKSLVLNLIYLVISILEFCLLIKIHI